VADLAPLRPQQSQVLGQRVKVAEEGAGADGRLSQVCERREATLLVLQLYQSSVSYPPSREDLMYCISFFRH